MKEFSGHLQIFFCSARTGIGFTPGLTIRSVKHKGTAVIPFVISLLAGKQRHYVQLGFGYSVAFGEDYINSATTIPTVYQKFEAAYTISLGYRYMFDGFVAQIYPILQWTNNPTSGFIKGFGISIGGNF